MISREINNMNLSTLQEDEKLLLRRFKDLSDIAAKGIPRFSFFLNERQVMIAEAFISQAHIENAILFGGYGGAARKLCGFFRFMKRRMKMRFQSFRLRPALQRTKASPTGISSVLLWALA